MDAAEIARSRTGRVSPRSVLSIVVLVGMVVFFLIELIAFSPNLMRLAAKDYWDWYVPWGKMLLAGNPNHTYPLATQLFVFVPMVLLPRGLPSSGSPLPLVSCFTSSSATASSHGFSSPC